MKFNNSFLMINNTQTVGDLSGWDTSRNGNERCSHRDISCKHYLHIHRRVEGGLVLYVHVCY